MKRKMIDSGGRVSVGNSRLSVCLGIRCPIHHVHNEQHIRSTRPLCLHPLSPDKQNSLSHILSSAFTFLLLLLQTDTGTPVAFADFNVKIYKSIEFAGKTILTDDNGTSLFFCCCSQHVILFRTHVLLLIHEKILFR
jgi:uncharacterized paraquat-inducible protein A